MAARAGVARRFGENLRGARRRADLSQEAVAIGASLYRTEIGLIERGERIPRIDTAIKLAGAVGASLEELAQGISWSPGRSEPGRYEREGKDHPQVSSDPKSR